MKCENCGRVIKGQSASAARRISVKRRWCSARCGWTAGYHARAAAGIAKHQYAGGLRFRVGQRHLVQYAADWRRWLTVVGLTGRTQSRRVQVRYDNFAAVCEYRLIELRRLIAAARV